MAMRAYIAIARDNAKRCHAWTMSDSTTVARLTCDEPTARRLTAALGESLDTEDAVCSAFEGESGQWQIAIHFRAPPEEKAVRALVKLLADEKAAAALTFEQVAAADWVLQSLAGLAPVHAGRFVVHGAHDRAKVPPNAIGVEIEAALAFGTGHHGTTRGCLLALDALAKRRRVRRALDIGTGSGVLAIAAAKAFRMQVVASDIDIRAVEAARANARLNRAAPFIMLTRAAGCNAPAIRRGKLYDLILANILLAPLVRLAVPLTRLAAPGALVVLSGLLPAHANAVLSLYRAQGLTLERRIALDGWVTLILRHGR
jgi:ribosomal protein L11 methyltransferase